MNCKMTSSTHRNNIKPMFFFVAFMVMILLGGIGTVIAQLSIGTWQFTSFNGYHYGSFGFNIIRIANIETILFSAISGFAFIALLIALSGSFALFTLLIITVYNFPASLATHLEPIFSVPVFVKFRNQKCLFASGTLFGYDLSSHFCLLVRRLWSEPVAAYDCGRLVLLYINEKVCQ